eukprot:COSAG02_NODE_20909_length_810_cov_1.457103_1_plen_33_part_10
MYCILAKCSKKVVLLDVLKRVTNDLRGTMYVRA